MRVVCVLTCVSLAWARLVHADPPAASEADKLFEEGRTLARAGDYAAACDKFEQSFVIEPTPGTELNLADCHEHLGHLRKAWTLYTAAAGEYESQNEPARAKFAREHGDAIAARLAEVVVQVAQPQPPGFAITIASNSATPAAEIHDRVEPGTINIVATAPGHPPFTANLQAAAGDRVSVAVPRFTDEPVAGDGGTDDRASRLRLAMWLGGGGVASAGLSLGFALVARSHWNSAADGPHCERVSDGARCDDIGSAQIRDAQHLADIGTGFFVGALGLAGAAAVIYFTAPSDRVVVTPVATGQTVGFQLTARY